MEIWQQISIIIATMLGIPAGIIIARMCREELKPGFRWFVMLQFFSLASIILMLIFLLVFGKASILPALAIILLIIASSFLLRTAYLFFFTIFIANLVSIFSLDSGQMIAIAIFSFIFLLSFTAYAQYFKQSDAKKAQGRQKR
jgi:ABC-type proline/glycine betaine transport system permease subunit